MAGLTLKCPNCKKKLNVRTSRSLTETNVEAFVFCEPCGIRAKAYAGLEDIQLAQFSPVPANHKWSGKLG
ncbi:hypothetical protein BMT54_08360 [Pasteurellaceae bacterium 15-036681]|nr:hypothetical protein BMT54_08360 [Pasteurellaceae bacterium 15-036681]